MHSRGPEARVAPRRRDGGRIEDGVLVEHWNVIQDEAIREQPRRGTPMFGDAFPVYR
jgi:hypothetical protein